MIRVLLVFLFLFSHLIGNSQFVLFLTNGESIEYKSYKIKDNTIILKTSSGTMTRSGDIASIIGYLNTYDGKFYYSKKFEDEYLFVERIFDGKINIYEQVVISVVGTGLGTAYNTGGIITYYENDNQLKSFSSLSRKKDKDSIMSLFADWPEIIKELNEKENSTDKEKIGLINHYNILNYKQPESTSTNSSTFFYSKIKRGENEALKLIVDERTEYLIPANKSISVGLSTEYISKICISFGETQECLTMQGSPYQIRYYEIVFNSVSGKMEVNKVSKTDAQKYLQFALKNK
jgi:hypothetical protein